MKMKSNPGRYRLARQSNGRCGAVAGFGNYGNKSHSCTRLVSLANLLPLLRLFRKEGFDLNGERKMGQMLAETDLAKAGPGREKKRWQQVTAFLNHQPLRRRKGHREDAQT